MVYTAPDGKVWSSYALYLQETGQAPWLLPGDPRITEPVEQATIENVAFGGDPGPVTRYPETQPYYTPAGTIQITAGSLGAGAYEEEQLPHPDERPAITSGLQPGYAEAGFGSTALSLGMKALPWVISAVPWLWEWFGGDLPGGNGTVNGGKAMNGVSNVMGGVPLVGPGVKEPPNYMVKKRWETRVYSNEYGYIKINFYRLNDMAGRYRNYVMYYNNTTGAWGAYKIKKHVVLSADPRMSQVRKLERVYDRTIKRLAKKSKALKLAK